MKKTNLNTLTIALPGNLPYLEATMDESDSFWFLQKWQEEFPDSYYYNSHLHGFDIVSFLANRFVLFCSKVEIPNKLTFFSPLPLSVFRYLMVEDLNSWDYYTFTNKRNGYVVEGANWSNGLLYQVRNHDLDNINVIQTVLLLSKEAKILNNFPDPETLLISHENKN
jgi:hypothetical protein